MRIFACHTLILPCIYALRAYCLANIRVFHPNMSQPHSKALRALYSAWLILVCPTLILLGRSERFALILPRNMRVDLTHSARHLSAARLLPGNIRED